MKRPKFVRGVTGLVAFVLAIFLVLPWCDVLAGNVVPVVQALTLVWVVLAGVCFVGALLTRRRWAVAMFAPALILALAASWLFTTSGETPAKTVEAGHHHLTMLSLNAEYGDADAASVMKVVRTRHPDIVVFVEMTKAKLDRLDSSGLKQLLPHRTAGMIDDGSRGSVVLSRWPLTTVDANLDLGHFDLQSPVARVQAPGHEFLVRAVHAYPPLQDGVQQWRPQLNRLARWQKAHRSDHLILAGDFNAAVTNPAFRSLRDGLTDAVAQQKTAAWPTWPHGSWMPAFVQIDHILTRGCAPERADTETIPGTDHAAIWATLRY